MLMYHKSSKAAVDVHPSKVESMQNKGWHQKPPTKPTPNSKEVSADG